METTAHVLSPAVVQSTATVILVLVAHHALHFLVLATVTMVNVFSMPITLRNHVFAMTDTLEKIVKTEHEQ